MMGQMLAITQVSRTKQAVLTRQVALIKKVSRAVGVLAVAAGFTVGLAACSHSDKPSQADVERGLVRSADFSSLNSLGLSDAQLAQVAQCSVEEIYEDFSEASLVAVAENHFDAELSSEEYSALSSAIAGCSLDQMSSTNN